MSILKLSYSSIIMPAMFRSKSLPSSQILLLVDSTSTAGTFDLKSTPLPLLSYLEDGTDESLLLTYLDNLEVLIAYLHINIAHRAIGESLLCPLADDLRQGCVNGGSRLFRLRFQLSSPPASLHCGACLPRVACACADIKPNVR